MKPLATPCKQVKHTTLAWEADVLPRNYARSLCSINLAAVSGQAASALRARDSGPLGKLMSWHLSRLKTNMFLRRPAGALRTARSRRRSSKARRRCVRGSPATHHPARPRRRRRGRRRGRPEGRGHGLPFVAAFIRGRRRGSAPPGLTGPSPAAARHRSPHGCCATRPRRRSGTAGTRRRGSR